MTCLDLILDRLLTHPTERVTLYRRTFIAARITIAGRADLSVEKQIALWAATHHLLCQHNPITQTFTFTRLPQ